MFKAFYWMFETNDLRKIFMKNSLYLLMLFLVVLLLLFIVWISGNVKSNLYVIAGLLAMFLTPLIPLVQLGYFWELTENIINRDLDVRAPSIYGGKVKTIEKLTIPNFKILKFAWRGFSSIFALLIMESPVLLIGYFILKNNDSLLIPPVITIQIIILFFANGLAWNYAKRNSVVSTLNIRAGIHLLGNYPIKYIWNSFLIIAAFIIIGCISIAITQPILIIIPSFLGEYTDKIVETVISLPLGIYFLHVNAYLIGTLAPPFKEECL